MDQTESFRTVPSSRALVNQDGAIIIDSEQGLMFSLNTTGGLIWQCLGRQSTVREVAEKVAAQFGIPYAAAEQDVFTFLARLKEQKLIEAVP
jgi:hypothetical protein